MRIKLIPQFSSDDVKKATEEFMRRANKQIYNELFQLGSQLVTKARMKTKAQNGFNDQTGNLRSSIGFIILYNGEEVHKDFELSSKGTEKVPGLEAGQEYADSIAREYPEGWALIYVAGMEYASYVEGREDHDVISGSTMGAEKKLRNALKRLSE